MNTGTQGQVDSDRVIEIKNRRKRVHLEVNEFIKNNHGAYQSDQRRVFIDIIEFLLMNYELTSKKSSEELKL